MPGVIGADLRPDLRRREAPPPQARHVRRPGQARRHQRAGLRRLRRLLVQVELPVGRAARDRVRPQARDRPVAPATRTTPASRASARASSPSKAASCARSRRRPPAPTTLPPLPEPALPALDRALRHPRHRRRRHRRGHRSAQLLGMAAHLEGKGVVVLDMAGLAQKGGAVLSHVRIADRPDAICTRPRIGTGEADLRARLRPRSSPPARDALAEMREGRTCAPSSTRTARRPAASSRNPDWQFPAGDCAAAIARRRRRRATPTSSTPTRLATALMGDSIATNLFMLGYAWQKGLVPLGRGGADARDRAQRRRGRLQQGAPSSGAAAPRTTSAAVRARADAGRRRARAASACRRASTS